MNIFKKIGALCTKIANRYTDYRLSIRKTLFGRIIQMIVCNTYLKLAILIILMLGGGIVYTTTETEWSWNICMGSAIGLAAFAVVATIIGIINSIVESIKDRKK